MPGRFPTRSLRRADGQATVELVALLPLVVAVAVGAYAVLAAGRAREQAGAAAHAAAVALLQDRDPRAAAREALPRGARVAIAGRRITVRVRPRVPLFSRALEAAATATAGGVAP